MNTKKTIKSKEENPITYQEAIDTFIGKLFSLTSSEITIIGTLLFSAGIFLQFSLLSSFIGEGPNAIYLVNIQTAILSTFSLIFSFIISLVFPFILIITIVLTILGSFYNSNFMPFFKYIFILLFILGLILLKFEFYRNLLLWVIKKLGKLYLVLVFAGLIFLLYFSGKTYKNVEIKTSSETLTGKFYFSNGEDYFLEVNNNKVILPKNEIKKIEFLK